MGGLFLVVPFVVVLEAGFVLVGWGALGGRSVKGHVTSVGGLRENLGEEARLTGMSS